MWSCAMRRTICIAGGQSAASLKLWQKDQFMQEHYTWEIPIFLIIYNCDKCAGRSVT